MRDHQNQEVFNVVVRHLLRQGVKSLADGRCLYRGPNGTKCAIGCLIPDHEYRPEFEGKTVNMISCPALPECDFRLLTELQHAHDKFDPGEWREVLTMKGLNRGLKMPEPE